MFRLVDGITQDLLGIYGRILLDFLLSNSLIICSIVVIYGAVLIFAQRNFDRICQKAKGLDKDNALSGENPAIVLANKGCEFWEQLQKDSQFPFIALPSSFFLYRINQTTMTKLLVRYFSPQWNKMKYLSRKKKNK